MRLTGLVMTHLHAGENCGRSAYVQRNAREHNVEAVRCANAAARMMQAFNDGITTLAQLRRGGRQTMVVQHVNVRDGGQAIVANKISRGGGRSARGKSRKGRKTP